MRKGDRRLRHKLGDPGGDIRDVIDAVIDIIDLPVPRQFTGDRLPHQFFIVLADKGLDRQSVLRRFLEDAHVADADQAHMKCSRNRRRRQREHIYIFLQLLDLLLVCHTEALLLIDNEQPQILEFHILRQNPVRPDHNIDHVLLEIGDCLLYLRRRPETAHQLHPDREILHSLYEGIIVLLRKDCRRHKVHDLFPLLHRLECGTDGNFRFSVADITADKTVHNLTALHVRLRVRNGIQLILRLLIGKHFLKLSLPDSILAKAVALRRLTRRV